jgi:HEAT repeat protein
MRLVERQSIIRFRWASAEDRRLRAVSGFEALGPVGVSAVPALLDLFAGDPDVAFCASAAVVSIGPGAVIPLTHALTNASPIVRTHAAAALGYFHSQAEPAIPTLITLMRDADFNVRLTVASSLGHIGGRPEDVVSALIRGLEDPSASVRDNSALSLGRFGPQAGVAAPALRKMIRDKRDPMGDAARALVRVDPEAAAEAGVR